MASTINPAWPVTGNPTTQSVRDNFTAAASDFNALETSVGANADALVALDTRVGTNETNISNNATAIGVNTAAIGDNTTAIGDNTTAIGDNTTAISDNTTAISDNESALSSHTSDATIHWADSVAAKGQVRSASGWVNGLEVANAAASAETQPTDVQVLTQAEYDGLTPDANTLYFITA